MGECHDRAQDDGLFPVLKSLQIGQGRIAGAEIAEREAGAKLANAGQHLRGIFGIFHYRAFGLQSGEAYIGRVG